MHPYMRANLVKVLAALQSCHRVKPIIVVSGDVHLSSAMRLCYSHNGIAQDCIPAYVTSGLTASAAAVNMVKLLAFDAWLYWPLIPQFSHLVVGGDNDDKLVREHWQVSMDSLELVNNYLTLDWNNSNTLHVSVSEGAH